MAKNETKAAKAPKAEDKRAVPAFTDHAGNMRKLAPKHFPSTMAGKVAYCEYQKAKWESKKAHIVAMSDPQKKKKAKIAKLRETLAALEDEIKAESK